MLISVLIVALRCDLARPWIFVEAQCPHVVSKALPGVIFLLVYKLQFARWQTVAGMDIITELALFSTSIYVVKNLQLSLQKKLFVVFAFGLRLP